MYSAAKFWAASLVSYELKFKLTAFPSDTAQGGFFHTDQIALIDQEGRIRGYYDGTSTKAVDQLFIDLHLLLKK